jgi:hypothetical protein
MLAGIDGVLEQWAAKAPGGINQWLAEAPDHPLHDQVAMTYLQRSQGQLNPDIARKVVEGIKDPALQKRAKQMVGEDADEEVLELTPEEIRELMPR